MCVRQDAAAELQRLDGEMRAEGERHKRELETARQQCRREVEEFRTEAFNQRKTKHTGYFRKYLDQNNNLTTAPKM